MQASIQDYPSTIALAALSFILEEDALRDRFLSLSGMSPEDLKAGLENKDFLASILEFLIQHEPDLLAFAEHQNEKPELIVQAWRKLGGGMGQEW